VAPFSCLMKPDSNPRNRHDGSTAKPLRRSTLTHTMLSFDRRSGISDFPVGSTFSGTVACACAGGTIFSSTGLTHLSGIRTAAAPRQPPTPPAAGEGRGFPARYALNPVRTSWFRPASFSPVDHSVAHPALHIAPTTQREPSRTGSHRADRTQGAPSPSVRVAHEFPILNTRTPREAADFLPNPVEPKTP
jgi:hypothetical protein